jgi:hypothetical protein
MIGDKPVGAFWVGQEQIHKEYLKKLRISGLCAVFIGNVMKITSQNTVLDYILHTQGRFPGKDVKAN